MSERENTLRILKIRRWKNDQEKRHIFWQKYWSKYGIENGKERLRYMNGDPCSKEIKEMSHELKVKALSLQEEARVIKNEEARALRLQRRYKSSKYRNRILEEAKAKAADQNIDLQHRAMIFADAEHNVPFKTYLSLKDHRKNVVRVVARATNVARGFLKGLPYEVIETYPKNVGNQKVTYLLDGYGKDGRIWRGPDWDRVTAMVETYGSEKDLERYPVWLGKIGLALDFNMKVVKSETA